VATHCDKKYIQRLLLLGKGHGLGLCVINLNSHVRGIVQGRNALAPHNMQPSGAADRHVRFDLPPSSSADPLDHTKGG